MNVLDLKEKQQNAPFIFFIPNRTGNEDFSFREENGKWASLKFFLNYKDNVYRVKEFFLDWFYTSFPKNLMSSFVDSYSPLTISQGLNGKIFIGKDYKGVDASSCYSLGTQIEIEGNRIYLKEVNDLLLPIEIPEKLRNMPFHLRSYFARNKSKGWFEEERIARMKWGYPELRLEINNSLMSSVGTYYYENKLMEMISIFNREFFTKVFWVDISLKNSSIPYLFYTLRRNGNIYSYTDFEGGVIAFLSDDGPGIFQKEISKFIITVSFSNDISVSSFKQSYSDVNNVINNIITKYF